MTTELKADKKPFTFWPYAIVLTFVLFTGYIGSFVYRAMQSNVDLVSADYYQKELAYQQHINTMSRTAQLATAVDMSHDAKAGLLSIALPQEFAGKPVHGTVQFFRPSNSALDFSVPLQVNDQLTQTLSTEKLQSGFWKVRLNFEAAGEPYFSELELTVAPQ